jgi:hypothetical protein
LARVAANTERLQRLLVGADTDGAGQVRAAAAVGALTRPVAVLADLNLEALHDTVVGAVLGAQMMWRRLVAASSVPRVAVPNLRVAHTSGWR